VKGENEMVPSKFEQYRLEVMTRGRAPEDAGEISVIVRGIRDKLRMEEEYEKTAMFQNHRRSEPDFLRV